MSFPLILEPYRESWKDAFAREKTRIREALGPTLLALHHIGSTAIPGIHAKPIIDMLAEVGDLGAVDLRRPGMERLGYEVMGEFGIRERRYFRKNDSTGVRTHHIHAFTTGSPHLFRHLAFRDYLIAHPDVAQEYDSLKLRLFATCRGDMTAYIDGKDPFVKAAEAEAIRWMASQPCSVVPSNTAR